jgi:hypothetical protein
VLAAEIGATVDDMVGAYEGRLNHWVMLTELNEGAWAGAVACSSRNLMLCTTSIGETKWV